MNNPKSTTDPISPLSSETLAISHRSIPVLEECAKWVRVKFGGETIADSSRTLILRRPSRLPVYAFLKSDIRADLLTRSDTRADFGQFGTAAHHNVTAGGKTAADAAWDIPQAQGEWQLLRDYMFFEWGAMDAWFEEDEEVFVHLRDPYHRVEVLDSSREVRVVVANRTLASSTRSVMLYETGFPTRFYIPRDDVDMQFLNASGHRTRCPYKGVADGYWSINVDDTTLENSVWSYSDPLPQVAKIKDHLCFYNERVGAIFLDGVELNIPVTPWSKSAPD